MKIVILDGYTLYDKDKMQETYSPLGDVTCYDRTAPNEVFERICNADAVLTNKVIISNEVMEKCPKLTYIGVLATGYNVVNAAYAALHNIVVTNVPAYSTMSVVQLVFAFVLAFACKVEPHNSAVPVSYTHLEKFNCHVAYLRRHIYRITLIRAVEGDFSHRSQCINLLLQVKKIHRCIA